MKAYPSNEKKDKNNVIYASMMAFYLIYEIVLGKIPPSLIALVFLLGLVLFTAVMFLNRKDIFLLIAVLIIALHGMLQIFTYFSLSRLIFNVLPKLLLVFIAAPHVIPAHFRFDKNVHGRIDLSGDVTFDNEKIRNAVSKCNFQKWQNVAKKIFFLPAALFVLLGMITFFDTLMLYTSSVFEEITDVVPALLRHFIHLVGDAVIFPVAVFFSCVWITDPFSEERKDKID